MNLTAEQIARVAHEVNRGYCRALGDRSQQAWEDAPDWQRASAIDGVEFHLRHPNASPAESHTRWYENKRAAGWSFGPKKDAEAKTHPCMVPFDGLPVSQRAKDYIFSAVVRALAPQAVIPANHGEPGTETRPIPDPARQKYETAFGDSHPERPVASAKLPNQPVKITR